MKYKIQFSSIVLGALVAGVSFYFTYPVFFVVGLILSLSNLIEVIWLIVHKEELDESEPSPACSISILITIALLVMCFVGRNSHCYILGPNTTKHLYKDCSHFAERNPVHEVSSVGAFVYLCFKECQYCSKRQEIEKQKRKAENERKRIEQDLQFIQDHIDELEDVKRRIRQGERIDVYDYCFGYEVDVEEESEFEI